MWVVWTSLKSVVVHLSCGNLGQFVCYQRVDIKSNHSINRSIAIWTMIAINRIHSSSYYYYSSATCLFLSISGCWSTTMTTTAFPFLISPLGSRIYCWTLGRDHRPSSTAYLLCACELMSAMTIAHSPPHHQPERERHEARTRMNGRCSGVDRSAVDGKHSVLPMMFYECTIIINDKYHNRTTTTTTDAAAGWLKEERLRRSSVTHFQHVPNYISQTTCTCIDSSSKSSSSPSTTNQDDG